MFPVSVMERLSPFWLNCAFLTLAGLWPPSSGLQRHAYLLYTGFAVFIQLWLMLGEIGAVFHFWGDLDTVTLLFEILSGTACSVVKVLYFLPRFARIQLLVSDMEALVTIQRRSSNPQVLKMLRESQAYAWRLSSLVMSFAALVGVMWGSYPLIQNSLSRSLPLNTWFPCGLQEIQGYVVTYVLQLFALQNIGLVLVGVDVLFFTFIIYATTQLKILCFNLSELGMKNDRIQNSKEKTVKSYEELRNCIKHHQEIIRLVDNTEDVVNEVLLPQFLGHLLMLCLSLYQSLETNNIGIIMCSSLLLLGVIFHLFVYCWHAQQLIEQSQLVSVAAYNANWIDKSLEFKKTVLTLMARSGKPLTLTCGKFSVISRGTFISVTHAAYSYYAILSQINRHKTNS